MGIRMSFEYNTKDLNKTTQKLAKVGFFEANASEKKYGRVGDE